MGEPVLCPSCRTNIDVETGGKPPQRCPHCRAEITTRPSRKDRSRPLNTVMALALIGLAIHFILPIASLRRELSRRQTCGSNMKAIATCSKVYRSEHESVSADPFRVLLDGGQITAEQLVCPSSGKTVQDIEKDPYACYVPVVYDMPGAESRNISSATILLYERDNHAGQGGNVVYADGHASFIHPYSEMLRQVEESKRRLATSQPAADGSGWESNPPGAARTTPQRL